MEGLDLLLQGLEESISTGMDMTPLAIVLMGEFTSTPFGASTGDTKRYQSLFEELTQLIVRYSLLMNSTTFVLVPGPSDPGVGQVLPRLPLARVFTQSLEEELPNVSIATNPCRLFINHKEIVLFRENLLGKLQRHCVIPPYEGIPSPLFLSGEGEGRIGIGYGYGKGIPSRTNAKDSV